MHLAYHDQNKRNHLKTYSLEHRGEILASGRSVGRQIGSGKARIILEAAHMNELDPGDVLITDITDPDWEPVMRKASAIVTKRGGHVCHAAIMLNIGNPGNAFELSALPGAGVGLTRLEFIIANSIGIHPRALPGMTARLIFTVTPWPRALQSSPPLFTRARSTCDSVTSKAMNTQPCSAAVH